MVSVLIAAAVLLAPVASGCQSTSCESLPGSPSQGVPSGSATLDVWANYTGGSYHFSKTSQLTLSGSVVSIGGHQITALTVRLALSVSNSAVSGYSGSLLVYTCGACGNQQASLGSIPITGAVTEGVILASSFPTLSPSSNITILVWPAGVSVSLASGQKLVLATSPIAISGVSTLTTTTAPSVPCPTTITLQEYVNGQFVDVGTGTLLSAQAAATLFKVSSYSGLDATYYLGGLSVFNVIYPGLGGSSAYPGYGLLSGFAYTSTGACMSR